MNDAKFSRLTPATDAWQKTEAPKVAKKEKSIRLNIDLETSRSSAYIFSYEDLIKSAKATKAKEDSAQSKNGCGLPDLANNDSVEELKNIASRYEQKYGREAGGKRRYQSYADLGAGYDEDDSFIDNTEANEEGIPEEMDTKKGGFYINAGKLELTSKR